MAKKTVKTIKEIFPNITARIEKAFICQGVQYYQFSDFMDMPIERSFQAMTFYREMECRVDRNYLLAHCDAMNNILTPEAGKGIDITQIAELHKNLKERAEFIIEPDIAYKLCTVYFFDETENPAKYDVKYNTTEKLKMFKNDDINAFFLHQPIGRLMPHLKSLEVDLTTYSQVIKEVKTMHLKVITQLLSSENKKKEYYSSLTSQESPVSV